MKPAPDGGAASGLAPSTGQASQHHGRGGRRATSTTKASQRRRARRAPLGRRRSGERSRSVPPAGAPHRRSARDTPGSTRETGRRQPRRDGGTRDLKDVQGPTSSPLAEESQRCQRRDARSSTGGSRAIGQPDPDASLGPAGPSETLSRLATIALHWSGRSSRCAPTSPSVSARPMQRLETVGREAKKPQPQYDLASGRQALLRDGSTRRHCWHSEPSPRLTRTTRDSGITPPCASAARHRPVAVTVRPRSTSTRESSESELVPRRRRRSMQRSSGSPRIRAVTGSSSIESKPHSREPDKTVTVQPRKSYTSEELHLAGFPLPIDLDCRKNHDDA